MGECRISWAWQYTGFPAKSYGGSATNWVFEHNGASLILIGRCPQGWVV